MSSSKKMRFSVMGECLLWVRLITARLLMVRLMVKKLLMAKSCPRNSGPILVILGQFIITLFQMITRLVPGVCGSIIQRIRTQKPFVIGRRRPWGRLVLVSFFRCLILPPLKVSVVTRNFLAFMCGSLLVRQISLTRT